MKNYYDEMNADGAILSRAKDIILGLKKKNTIPL